MYQNVNHYDRVWLPDWLIIMEKWRDTSLSPWTQYKEVNKETVLYFQFLNYFVKYQKYKNKQTNQKWKLEPTVSEPGLRWSVTTIQISVRNYHTKPPLPISKPISFPQAPDHNGKLNRFWWINTLYLAVFKIYAYMNNIKVIYKSLMKYHWSITWQIHDCISVSNLTY